jgi:hypothetical protein
MKHRIMAFFYEYRNPLGLALVGGLYIAFVNLSGLS